MNDKILERSILSEIILLKKIPPGLIPDYFSGEEKKFFEALQKQWNSGCIDPAVLRSTFPAVIESCLEIDGSASPVAIEALKSVWQRNQFDIAIRKNQNWEDTPGNIKNIQHAISEIIFSQSSEEYDQTQQANILSDALRGAQEARKEVRGYPTTLKALDGVLGGLERGKTYAVGALKKTGKTRFGVFLSMKLLEQGAGVYWNSLEMSRIQLNTLALAYLTGVNSSLFGKQLYDHTYASVQERMKDFSRLKWSIYKDHLVSDLKSRIYYERQKKEIDVVFVDFIQRMRSPKYSNDRVREVENISQDLADLARDLNVAVIEFSQLSGAAEKLPDDEIPNMSHFKESQGIPENADAILTLHNPGRHEQPYDNANNYIPQNFSVRIEQRYDVSGAIVKIHGDLRTCLFGDGEYWK